MLFIGQASGSVDGGGAALVAQSTVPVGVSAAAVGIVRGHGAGAVLVARGAAPIGIMSTGVGVPGVGLTAATVRVSRVGITRRLAASVVHPATNNAMLFRNFMS